MDRYQTKCRSDRQNSGCRSSSVGSFRLVSASISADHQFQERSPHDLHGGGAGTCAALRYLLYALIAGSAIVLPALIYLLKIFKLSEAEELLKDSSRP
jgi:hypothetical protein